MAGDGHLPESAQTVGTSPSAAVDGVVRAILIDPGAEAGRAELEGQFSKLWWKLRYQFRPNSLHHRPYILRDDFEDGRFSHAAMDRLQFGGH